VTGAPIIHQPGFLASRLKFGKLWCKKKKWVAGPFSPVEDCFFPVYRVPFLGCLFIQWSKKAMEKWAMYYFSWHKCE
jgi:hypothetical protein